MEHKFTIEVILKYDCPKTEAKKPNTQALQIDSKFLESLIPQLAQIISSLKQNKDPKKS